MTRPGSPLSQLVSFAGREVEWLTFRRPAPSHSAIGDAKESSRREWSSEENRKSISSCLSPARMRTRRGRPSLSCIWLSAGLGSRLFDTREEEAVLFLEPQRSALSWRRRYS